MVYVLKTYGRHGAVPTPILCNHSPYTSRLGAYLPGEPCRNGAISFYLVNKDLVACCHAHQPADWARRAWTWVEILASEYLGLRDATPDEITVFLTMQA